jgi:hypothetical protein
VAVSLAFLRPVDAVESDVFGVLVVQDFEGVAIEDGDDGASQLSCKDRTGKQEREEDNPETSHGPHARSVHTPWRGDHYQVSVG